MTVASTRVRLDDAAGARNVFCGRDPVARSRFVDSVVADLVAAGRQVRVLRPRATHLGLLVTEHAWLGLEAEAVDSEPGAALVIDDLGSLDAWADRSFADWLATPAAAAVTIIAGAPFEDDAMQQLLQPTLRAYRRIVDAGHQRVDVDRRSDDAGLVPAESITTAMTRIAQDRSIDPRGVAASTAPDAELAQVLDPAMVDRLAALTAVRDGEVERACELLERSATTSRRDNAVTQALHDLHMRGVVAHAAGFDGLVTASHRRRASVAVRELHPMAGELIDLLRAHGDEIGDRDVSAQADVLGHADAPAAIEPDAAGPWQLLRASRMERVGGDCDAAGRLATAALACARRREDREAEIHALEMRAVAFLHERRVEDARRLAQVVGRMLRADGAAAASRVNEAMWLAVLDMRLLRHRDVLATCDLALRANEQHGHDAPPGLVSVLHVLSSAAWLRLGELEQARRSILLALALVEDEDVAADHRDLVVAAHIGLLVELGDERAVAQAWARWAPEVTADSLYAHRMRAVALAHIELRDGWTEPLEAAAIAEVAEDGWHAIFLAEWLVRMGIVYGVDAAIQRGIELLDDAGDAHDPREELVVRGVRRVLDYRADVGAGAAAIEVLDELTSRGMRLDAARLQLLLAIVTGEHGDGVAARQHCLDARAEFVAMGAQHDARHANAVDADLRRRRVGRRRPGRRRATSALPVTLRSAMFSNAVRHQLQAQTTFVRLDPDALIFETGTLARHVYVVQSGLVRVTRESRFGGELTTGLTGPGDMIGELASIGSEGGTHAATAHALGDTVVARILAADLADAMRTHVDLRDAIHALIARRAELWVQQAMAIAFQPVGGRIAGVLLYLANRFGHPTLEGDVLIHAPLTQAHLASMIGATRQSASRAMSELMELGIVEQRDRRILVRDMAALAGRAAG